MWLITHATGTIGRAVFHVAQERGHRMRVIVRDNAQAASFGPTTEVLVGDLADPAGLKSAFTDVEAALISAPLGAEFAQWHRALAEAARSAHTERVVQVSAQGADLKSPMRIFRWMGDAEAQAATAGLHATVLRPSLYMQTFLKQLSEIRSCGVIEAPMRDAVLPLVDARDVAQVAVTLLENGAKPAVRELTGPQALDYTEIARTVSKVTGWRVAYLDVCSPKARGRLEAKRVPPRLIEALLELWDFMSAGAIAPRVTNEVEVILGRPATRFVDFLKDHRSAFSSRCR
jgi:uncharacterized protein YbjT (DUF2867 family)